MHKLRVCVVSLAGAVMVAGSGGAAGAVAATGGDPNAGDVWPDNVGQPAGPGHENDAHLACQDIDLWGAGLADSSGTFTIDGWTPTGSKEQDYTGAWSYGGGRGAQVIAVINVQQLIAQAAANGDRPAKQGYHFKLQLTQDPQKQKTFWVNCPVPPPPSPAAGTPGGGVPQPTGHRRPHARRHRHLLKPKRHHRARARDQRRSTRTRAVFTG
jgi:hypothetical protein